MLNSIALVGRLTRDPELRQTNSGTSIGGFTIACDGRKNQDGTKEVLFMDCDVFGAQSDTLVKFFHKGNLIAVTGRLMQRKYVNKDGANVTAYSVHCDHIDFVESSAQMQASASGNAQQPSAQPSQQNTSALEITDDQLPF